MSKVTDPIADFLTRIRNGIQAKHRVVDIPASNLKKEITKLLKEKGYILNYKFEDGVGYQGNIKIALKYNPETKISAIKKLERIAQRKRLMIDKYIFFIFDDNNIPQYYRFYYRHYWEILD